MGRLCVHPSFLAAAHVGVFLFIVIGSGSAMIYLTKTSRVSDRAADVSKPIPEMLRWHTESP